MSVLFTNDRQERAITAVWYPDDRERSREVTTNIQSHSTTLTEKPWCKRSASELGNHICKENKIKIINLKTYNLYTVTFIIPFYCISNIEIYCFI